MSKITSESQAKFRFSSSRILLLLAILLVASVAAYVISVRTVNDKRPCMRLAEDSRCIVELEFARTSSEQRQGLSGRDMLAENKGLMFNFVKPGVQCFWMKDMKFSIDIIWISNKKQILHIEHNVTPQTYPNSYCPPVDAQHVLEINANQAKELQLETGQQLFF